MARRRKSSSKSKSRRPDLPPGFSFSLNRALGITRLKQYIARKTGIPTTKRGRQQKVGRLLGCQVVPLLLIGLGVAAVWVRGH
ncbi:MAG TPA: hypothetical protein DCZ72_00945 [Armatimonadetes bacterium]|nr:hypothetical protein [Armatimonadota bacterium]